MLRPISQFKQQADRDDRDADADDEQLGLLLRGRHAVGGGVRLVARPPAMIVVGGGQHLARLGRDDRDARATILPLLSIQSAKALL